MLKDDMQCLKCLHTWKKRLPNPERCPYCISKRIQEIPEGTVTILNADELEEQSDNEMEIPE